MAVLNERGHELLDATPVARAVEFRRPPTLQEQIRALVRGELSRQAQEQGQESFEEADDFDVDDDSYDPRSPWELNFDQELEPRVVREPAGEAGPAVQAGGSETEGGSTGSSGGPPGDPVAP